MVTLTRAFSCFVDDDPIMRAQAFIWLNCLTRIQCVSPSAIFVHMARGATDFRGWLHAEGVHVVDTEAFDNRNKYCHKLQQLSTFVDSEYDQVVLMDCDTAWIGDRELPQGDPLAAKIVDFANPPESALRAIFLAAGLGDPHWQAVSFPQGPDRAVTDANNCNGGLYICSRDFVGKLAPRWRHWARWCLDRPDLFGAFVAHADQVSFALAMRELDVRVTLLDLSWNYPTHIGTTVTLPNVSPNILHYHREMTPHMALKPTRVEVVDRAIEMLNASIASFVGKRLVNSIFWDFRYAMAPELGSGVGSRGENLEYKRELLAGLLNGTPNASVVDVGCGDLEVTRDLVVSDYTGLDVSEAALRLARQKRPNWKFQLTQAGDSIPAADVVICLDVLIHQPTEESFFDLVWRLAAASQRTLLVSGYEEPPTFTSDLTRYFEPLSQVLRRTGAFTDIQTVGRYRDTTVLAASKAVVEPHVTSGASDAPKVVVASGWWCDTSTHDWALGSAVTRSPAFFDLWYRQVVRCLAPIRIVVTDSASPLKPDIHAHPLLQWVELDQNYGHPNDIRIGRINTKYSGFTRSVLNGAMFALCCDADFFVYVEQDCLLWGADFLRHAVGASPAEIFLGQPTENGRGMGGRVAAPMLQQSLIVVRRSGLERFLSEILGAPWTDGDVSPEETMRMRLEPYELLQVPYGRSRPIDFSRSHFYAQHLDDEELAEFTRRIEEHGSATPDGAAQAASVTAELQALATELDEWLRAGKRAKFWWRDDDTTADTPALRRLLRLAATVDTVVALAVIPSEADADLPAALRKASCVVWQHGWLHKWTLNETAKQYSSGEFGEGRSLESMMHDAMQGQRAMDRLFGSDWERVFVPPFHALTMPFKSVLPILGYRGVSSGLPYKPPIATVPEVSAEIDIIDWPKRCFHGSAVVVGLVVDQLRALRQGNANEFRPIGILTHHRVMQEAAWDFTAALFAFLHQHPAAELIPGNRVFDLLGSDLFEAQRASGEHSPSLTSGEVTVVVTSCGRQDLLERTLDSFLHYNTHPIKEFIIMEDGDGERNATLALKYRGHPMRWLSTGTRVGQIAAIDRAYSEVTTEYIFHCEDDWEFHAPGFIEKSEVILENNPSILQVWLRGLADTNRHPMLDFELLSDGVAYRLLRHFHDAGEWGVWHGLSWNPGLRRTRDYQLLGSFGSLDPGTRKETWRVEYEAGAFYQQRGFYAAVLAANGDRGYVRHIGGDRRVARDYLPAGSKGSGTRRGSEEVIENLIFDLGSHRGEDTDYYLRRGFRVVAVECAPAEVAVMRSRFESELRDGRLTLIERAIVPQSGRVAFQRNKSVWGTAEKTWADRDIGLGTEVVEIVDGIQPEELFHEFGIPYYLKIDLEGRDLLVAQALEGLSVRPPYLSLAAERRSMQALREEFIVLRTLGYDRFKLSPQHHVGKQRVPGWSLQGRPVIWTFEAGSSGLFGEDLAGPWLSEENALRTYEPILLIHDLERAIQQGVLTGSLSQFLGEFGYELGWYDTHARHSSWPGRPPRARFGAALSDAKPAAGFQEGPDAHQQTGVRDKPARLLMDALSRLMLLSYVTQNCERRVPGVDEVPEWQVWVDKGTTPDQRRIEEHLEKVIRPSSRLLHIGAGNSSLGARFSPRVETVVGTTIHDEERVLAESLGLANYSVVVANKYANDMDQVSGRYDFIIDNNPASFACCLFHFAKMLVTYVDLLNDSGILLTAEPGMHWVVTNNDPNWALSLEDWRRIGEIVGLRLEDLGADVYAMRRSVDAGSIWRGR